MDVVTKKYYKCFSCSNQIVHVRIENARDEILVHDISACDFSLYDYKIEGGQLFPSRPAVKERLELEETLDKIQLSDTNADAPIGGICDDCLKTESTKNLVAASRIEFAAANAF